MVVDKILRLLFFFKKKTQKQIFFLLSKLLFQKSLKAAPQKLTFMQEAETK